MQALVFDAYGTLFDVHSVARRCDELFAGRGREVSLLWRQKQLEYTWLRTLMGRYEDFEAVTRAALIFVCNSMQLSPSKSDVDTLLHEYRRLTPYPEVVGALRGLPGKRLAILSNGSPDMLRAVVESSGLASCFEQVLSVDELRLFKPHPSIYQLAVERLSVAKESVAFVSSNFWDVSGAASYGFKTYWINRFSAQPDELGQRPTATLTGLDQLSTVLE